MHGMYLFVLVGAAVIIQNSLGIVQYGNDGNNENIQENEQVYFPQNTNNNNNNVPVNGNVPNGGNNMAEATTWQTRGNNTVQTGYNAPNVPKQTNSYQTYANGPIVYWVNKTNNPPYWQRNDIQTVQYQPLQNHGNVEVPVRIVYQQQLPSPPIRRVYPNNGRNTNENYHQNGEGQGYRYNNQNQNTRQYTGNGQGQYINRGDARANIPVYTQRYPNTNYGNTRGNGYENQQRYPNANYESTWSTWNDQGQRYPNVNRGYLRAIGNNQAQSNQNVNYAGTPGAGNGYVQSRPNINSGTDQRYPNGQGNVQNANPQVGGNAVQGLAQNPIGVTDPQNGGTNGNTNTAGNTLSPTPIFVDLDRFGDGMDEIIYD